MYSCLLKQTNIPPHFLLFFGIFHKFYNKENFSTNFPICKGVLLSFIGNSCFPLPATAFKILKYRVRQFTPVGAHNVRPDTTSLADFYFKCCCTAFLCGRFCRLNNIQNAYPTIDINATTMVQTRLNIKNKAKVVRKSASPAAF